MKILILVTSILLVGCAHNSDARASSVSDQGGKVSRDPHIYGADILGIRIGMDPRTVSELILSDKFKLDYISIVSINDYVNNDIGDAHFYLDTNFQKYEKVEVHFQHRHVIVVKGSYRIRSDQIDESIAIASSELSAYGKIKVINKDLSTKIIYSPYDYGYIFYDFYKYIENQKEYDVSYAIAGNYILDSLAG